MADDALPSNVPAWLQKDLVSTFHEVPVANGRSHTVQQNYYTPRLVRWALDQWLASLPVAADLHALQRTLQTVCADARTFHAYLQVPEAFADIYDEEIGKLSEHRSELDSVKRVLDANANRYHSGWVFLLGCTLFAAIAVATVALTR
ncbi:MAG: hypothetical protein JRG80_08040 [Deltaproteobacteria bacterium]|nr:hypothetical protein [Deltaproteobacteria bacterium]MBW2667308.1 hypothetical protein [Deltaproteobacteria bacterium]